MPKEELRSWGVNRNFVNGAYSRNGVEKNNFIDADSGHPCILLTDYGEKYHTTYVANPNNNGD